MKEINRVFFGEKGITNNLCLSHWHTKLLEEMDAYQ